jgi:hypothetical protein
MSFRPDQGMSKDKKYFPVIRLKSASIMDVNHNLFQFCNGHDFMKVLSVYLKPMKQVKPSDLESKFRIAFTHATLSIYKFI